MQVVEEFFIQRGALIVQALGRQDPMEGTTCPAPPLPWLRLSAAESVRAETCVYLRGAIRTPDESGSFKASW